MCGIGNKLKDITINSYINPLKRPIIKKEEYYWIMNGYLYISNPLLQAIRVSAFFEQDIPNSIMYPECGCGPQPTNEEWCMNPLDKEYACPGYLEKQVLELTSQKLLQTYFALKTDMTFDGVDGQAPNAKPTS